MAEVEEITSLIDKIGDLRKNIHQIIIGQENVIDQILIGLLANGHVLLEGVPGLAKTLMVKTLADSIHGSFKRIQFTPDLMPSDILGTELLQTDQQGNKYFKFTKGPVFANIVLADEINRTPPKTQSALLELMQERSMTYAGKTYPMPNPFFLLATQNPIEQAGTFPLPEAQVDRFLLHIKVDYPSLEEEERILSSTTGKQDISIHPVFEAEEISELQILCREVTIDPGIVRKVTNIIRNTRPDTTTIPEIKTYVDWGAGPRAGQAVILAAKAMALIRGRYAVIPDDIQQVLLPCLRHRLLLNFKANTDNIRVQEIIPKLI